MQTFGKKRKDKKSVTALRAVEVIDIERAPKFFVIAPAHEEPRKPIVTNIMVQNNFLWEV